MRAYTTHVWWLVLYTVDDGSLAEQQSSRMVATQMSVPEDDDTQKGPAMIEGRLVISYLGRCSSDVPRSIVVYTA